MNKNETKYNDKEFNVLKKISDFCKNDCGNALNCAEDKCILYRIEKNNHK